MTRGRLHAGVLLAVLACVCVPRAVRAQPLQQTRTNGALFEAGVASIKVDGFSLATLGSAASSLWGTSGRFSGAGTGTLARFETGSTTGYADLHGALALSSDRRNISAIRADAGGGAYRGETSSRYGEASVTLGRSFSSGAASGWLDAGAGRVDAAATVNTSHARVGGSLRSAAALVGADAGVVAAGTTRYAEAVLHTRFAPFGTDAAGVARLVIGADGGVRSSDDVQGRRSWAMAEGTVQIAGPVFLVAYAGAQPADPARGTLGAAFTSVALRVALGPARRPRAVRVEADAPRGTMAGDVADDGRRTISVALGDARTVEIMGDFTAWLPVPMTRSATGRWQLRVPLAEGSHRVEVRVDSGEWIPAPGLPAIADEFGGRVGILVVQ